MKKKIVFIVFILFILIAGNQFSAKKEDTNKQLYSCHNDISYNNRYDYSQEKSLVNGEKIELGTLVDAVYHKKRLKENNIGVAVLDTGIYPHKNLLYPKNRIIANIDFVNYIKEVYDDNGHGTAVAGIIGGESSDLKSLEHGVCTNVNFISVKVLDYQGKGKVEDLIRGLKWVILNRKKYNIRIVNVSMGYVAKADTEKIEKLIKKVNRKGILVIAAAGNDKKESEVLEPANCKGVISVGSLQKIGTIYKKSIYSKCWINYQGEKKPDIYALGENVKTLDCNVYYKGRGNNNDTIGYCYQSGTSIATAIVSGVVARIMNNHPDWSNDKVKKEMISNSIEIVKDEIDISQPILYLRGE